MVELSSPTRALPERYYVILPTMDGHGETVCLLQRKNYFKDVINHYLIFATI